MHRYDRGWARGYGEPRPPRRYGAWYGPDSGWWGRGYDRPGYGAPWAYPPPGPPPWWRAAHFDAPFPQREPYPDGPVGEYPGHGTAPGSGWPGRRVRLPSELLQGHTAAGDADLDYDDDDWDEELDDYFGDDEELDEFSALLDETGTSEDADLVARVTAALQRDGFLEADAIEVTVDDRVVTLRGEVGDYMQARYAWDDAWEVPGVRGVVSKLTVRGMERQEAPTNAARKATKAKQPRKP